jgi:hypothetical protein
VLRSFAFSRRLRISQPVQARKALFYNSFEKSKPFRLLLIPGLLLGYFIYSLEQSVLSILDRLYMWVGRYGEHPSLKIIGRSPLSRIVIALLLTPAEVITRLALHGPRPPDLLI